MLLDPVAAGSPLFDRATIERLIAQCIQPAGEKAGLRLWQEYNPAHRYAIGADTKKGNGNDHSTSVLIDFSTMPGAAGRALREQLIPADSPRFSRKADLFGSSHIASENSSGNGER
ncbi:hypothetical protein [Nitrobacter vulgaris]|jgi:hypothetical protein|uniref:hypothetical protein n=1 Tax=Nitrobacter vulgaris TaxID=29421 RepID=UPI00191C82B5|nr:hypothetical protein [Nitrobacter vulgaris]